MNKKFFSALLMGSLLLGGTFVSCSDYDDDIKNLQEQINNLATKSDVEARLSQLQSALTAAQSTATEALAAAKAADNTAEVKALQTKLADIETALAAVKSAQEAVSKEVADQLAAFDEATKKAIADAQKKTEETVGKVADYVTAADFIYRNDDADGIVMDFVNGQIGNADILFGKEEKCGEDAPHGKYHANSVITYAKKSWYSFVAGGSPIIRVSPSNAVITKDMVQIVNGKGENLSIVEIADVQPFSGDITRGIGTGLYRIDLKLADGTTDAKFAAAKTAGTGNDVKAKAYAFAINNTSTAEERFVLTDFNLRLGEKSAYVPETSVANVTFQSVETMDKPRALVNTKGRDNDRAAKAPIPAKNGEKIHIAFPETYGAQYFYVVRDDQHVETESDKSEINAWNSYSYTGLGDICNVADGTDISITIPENLASGDEVAFRMFVCNYDGSLVRQYGSTFVVYVGKNQNQTSVAGNLTVALTKNTDNTATAAYTTGWLPVEGTIVNGVALPTTVTVTFADKSTKTLSVAYAAKNDGTAASENKNIKFAKFTAASVADFKAWKDGATATGQIVTLDAKGLKENVIAVELTKVLPDAEATKKMMGYAWKAGQLVNGVYTAYLYPTNEAWTTANAASGFKNMTQAINGLFGDAYLSVANSASKTEGDKTYWKNALYTDNNYVLTVSNASVTGEPTKLIDNTTERDMTIGYNFGAISSENNDPYMVDVESVKIVYSCPLATTVQTYAWKKHTIAATATTPAVSFDVNVVTYNKPWNSEGDFTPALTENLATYLVATNTFDNTVFGGNFMTLLGAKYVNAEAKLISNETGNVDYFDVTIDSANKFQFAPKSGTTNPAADVPSTLVIKLTDAFGHEMEYKMPFTVKRAQ